MRASRGRAAVSSCARVSLMLLAAWLVWSVANGALWLGSRLSAASHYLDDVDDWTDLAERPLVRSAIHDLVSSGALASVTRETLSRVHLTTIGGDGDGDGGNGDRSDRFPKVQTLGIDVSHSGEATFLYGRFQKTLAHVKSAKKELGFAPLVVDVGANDGFLKQQLVQPRAVGVEQRADRAQSRDAEARGSRAERIRGPRARRVADRVLRERRHGGRQGEGDAQAEAGGGRRQHGEQSGEALRREKK
jgi:hypothetical protein